MKPIMSANDREAFFREGEPVNIWERARAREELKKKRNQSLPKPQVQYHQEECPQCLVAAQEPWPPLDRPPYHYERRPGYTWEDLAQSGLPGAEDLARNHLEHLDEAGSSPAPSKAEAIEQGKAHFREHPFPYRDPDTGESVVPKTGVHEEESAVPHIGPIAEYDPSMYSDLPWRKHAAAPSARYIFLPHWDPQECVDIMHDHAADMGYRVALQVTPELMQQAQQGGFTLHDHVGDAPTHGYMVSLAKNAEQKLPMSELSPQHVQNFVGQHTRELANPDTYLGGWLDGPSFYLDVSSHRPTLDRAARDAAANNQLGIYDLDHGKTIDTEEAGWRTGLPQIVGGRDRGEQLTFFGEPEELPDHDWGQHGLGDVDHWDPNFTPPGQLELDYRYGMLDANGQHVFPGMDQLGPTETKLGTHGAEVHTHPGTGEKWLVKDTPSTKNGDPYNGPFLAHGDVAASAIQQYSGVKTPPTFLTEHNGVPASAQLMFNAKDAFPSKTINPEKLSDTDLMTIQKHHVLDWLMGNHDSHGGQFVRDQDGDLVGIDKGQAFKHFSQDKLDWNFHPNAKYGEKEPIYNTLWRNFARGGRQVNDPREGELGQFIQHLQDIPDEEYSDTLGPYANEAQQVGGLARPWLDKKQYPPRFAENHSIQFLKAAIERKNNLSKDFGDLYDRANLYRLTGLKVAMMRYAYMPDPATMTPTGKTLGSHQSEVYTDPQGQWLVKQTNPGNEFLVPLDAATYQLQNQVGLPAPETYAVPMGDQMTTAVKMYPEATERWSKSPSLSDMTPNEQLTVQKHHALDWLIANHDAHVGNWMNTRHGLVGIDKGQALKYFGQDRLDHDFQPNYYARPPIYNRLWKDFGRGKPGEMLDPREGELGEFVQKLQNIPDWKLRQMFSPYAWSAANAGMLSTGAYGKGKFGPAHPDPSRGLSPSIIPPNDPGAFLDALVERKNNLSNDLGKFYDDHLSQRQYAQAHPPPPKSAPPPSKGYPWSNKSKSKGYPWSKSYGKPLPPPHYKEPAPPPSQAPSHDPEWYEMYGED